MPVDLREHVLNRSTAWFASAEARRIVLSRPGDAVTLAGPLHIRVGVHARNDTLAQAEAVATVTSPLFDYTLRIPSSHTWSYALGEHTPILTALGVNAGIFVVIEPVLGVAEAAPRYGTAAELSCDLGTHDRPDASAFFPVGCEPCGTHLPPSMPPLEQPLELPVARGGCVRPRYFDGMFLTREDLEAEQRYHLVKNRLQNRAAGAGVVWGLDVGLEQRSVCVKPGLAWDCCGRDLVVTAPYLVEIAALLRDPAAAATLAAPGPHRMHLLLEYVECAEDPRPVHGDPCAPEVTSCEMGRTRETVRLRLVPPRDFAGAGPIDRFLGQVAGVDWDPGLDPTPIDEPLPFEVRILREGTVIRTVRPMTLSDQGTSTGGSQEGRYELIAAPDANVAFAPSSVVVRRGNGDPVVAIVAPDGLLRWKVAREMGPELDFEIRWTIGSRRGATRVTVVFAGMDLKPIIVHATAVTRAVGPCDHEPCAAAGGDAAPLFPTDPPFLHPHPTRADRPADPRVLQLAWEYAWSWIRGNGPAPGEIDPAIVPALRELLEAWCESMLYRGPECGKAKPHGVVIGCALVEGGDLRHVDPWGGRRWSLQYGLIAHWATQLGILPPDLLMSKLAALACCVGDLPRLQTAQPVAPPVVGPVGPRPDVVTPGGVRGLVDAVVARENVAVLLRGATAELATSIAGGLSLAELVEGRPPWLSRLAGAGVSTVEAALAASPEALHEDVLRGEHAAELGALLARAERAVEDTTHGVARAIVATAAERRLATRADLAGAARPAIEAAVVTRLGEAKVPRDAAAVHRAVDAVVKATAARRGQV